MSAALLSAGFSLPMPVRADPEIGAPPPGAPFGGGARTRAGKLSGFRPCLTAEEAMKEDPGRHGRVGCL